MNKKQTTTIDQEAVKGAIRRLKGISCAFNTVRQCIDALEDPEISGREIEQYLVSDQGLVTRVLKLANSAYFGISGRVSTVPMAVGVIGHRRLRLTLERILIADMLGALNGRGEPSRAMREFGVVVAGISHDVSTMCWVGDPEELLTVGLLHNIGDLALSSLFPAAYENVEELAYEVTRHEAELAVFGVDSGTAGGWLLDGWRFPPIYSAASRYWRTPLTQGGEDDLQQRLCVVHTGVQLATAFLEKRPPEEAFELIATEVSTTIELQREMVASLYEQVPSRINRVRALTAA